MNRQLIILAQRSHRHIRCCTTKFFKPPVLRSKQKVFTEQVQQLTAKPLYNVKFYGTQQSSCWSCNQTQILEDTFFCTHCGVLKEIDENINFFDVFGIEQSFNLDDNKLSKKFREIQAKLHPDRYARKSDEEQALSIEWSSLVNVAYQTLHPPFKRATYLLKKHGINLPETNDAIDRAFLVNMMERNEEVEDAENVEAIKKLQRQVKVDIDDGIKQLDQAMKQKNYDKAKELLVRMKYYNSLEMAIKDRAVKKFNLIM